MSSNASPRFATLGADVHQALRDWQGDSNAPSPLGYLYLLRQAQREEQGATRQATNRVLLKGIAALQETAHEDAELLQLRFLDLLPVYRLANQFNIAESTLYTRQREGIGRLTETIMQLDTERAMSFRVQGLIAIDHYRWQEAEDLHRSALHLSEKQEDAQRIAWSLQNLGYALRGQKRFADAIDCFERATTILESIQDIYHWAIVQMNLGVAYRFSRNADSALACHLQAAEVFRKLDDRVNLAKLYTNLGLDYLALEAWGEAEQAFKLSIDLYAQLGDEGWRLNAVDGLAMTYLSYGQYTQAISVLAPAVAALPGIAELTNYKYLSRSLIEHLEQAEQGLATSRA